MFTPSSQIVWYDYPLVLRPFWYDYPFGIWLFGMFTPSDFGMFTPLGFWYDYMSPFKTVQCEARSHIPGFFDTLGDFGGFLKMLHSHLRAYFSIQNFAISVSADFSVISFGAQCQKSAFYTKSQLCMDIWGSTTTTIYINLDEQHKIDLHYCILDSSQHFHLCMKLIENHQKSHKLLTKFRC